MPAHLVHIAFNEVLTLASDVLNKLLGVGRITNTLEEFDALLTLEFLQSAVLLDELLLVSSQFHTFQVVQDVLLSLTIGIS